MFATARAQRFKLDRTKNIRNESNNAMMGQPNEITKKISRNVCSVMNRSHHGPSKSSWQTTPLHLVKNRSLLRFHAYRPPGKFLRGKKFDIVFSNKRGVDVERHRWGRWRKNPRGRIITGMKRGGIEIPTALRFIYSKVVDRLERRERKVVDIFRRYFVEESRTRGTAKPRREINGNNIYVGWDTWTKDDFGF